MTRFFVSGEAILGQTITLTGDNAAHARVLRLNPGDPVMVCDGHGTECLCQVESAEQKQTVLSVQSRSICQSEAKILVRLYLGFPKADKLEHVIQKATELGAAEVVAFPAARCVSRPDEKSLIKKVERWQKIAASAAEQSGRGIIPAVRVLPSYAAALAEAAQADLPVLFYENEAGYTFSKAIHDRQGFHTVSLLTGPEGGLEPQEVDAAQSAGLLVCTLGKRILRCETAPLCALSAVMFAAGEF